MLHRRVVVRLAEWRRGGRKVDLAGVIVVVWHLRGVGQRANRAVVLVVARLLRVRRHRRVVEWGVLHAIVDGCLVVCIVEVALSADRASRGTARADGGDVVSVVVDGDVRERRLGKRLGNELALLVLEMRVVASGFLLRKGSSLGKTLLVPALDNLRDTLEGS